MGNKQWCQEALQCKLEEHHPMSRFGTYCVPDLTLISINSEHLLSSIFTPFPFILFYFILSYLFIFIILYLLLYIYLFFNFLVLHCLFKISLSILLPPLPPPHSGRLLISFVLPFTHSGLLIGSQQHPSSP